MKNKILNKHFFIKKGNAIYCGKCGKSQMQDAYNLKKHADACGFPVDKMPRIFHNGEDYAYAFKISEDGKKLMFYIFVYTLKLIPGFKDKYSGGEWTNVYCASFLKDNKEIREKGLYDIDIWMKHMIDNKHIPSLSSCDDIEIFKSFFTDILSIESYGAFLDIYRNKGYGNRIYTKEDMDKIDRLMKANSNLELIQKDSINKVSNIIVDGKTIITSNNDTILCLRIGMYIIASNTVKSTINIAVSDGFAYCHANCKSIVPALLYSDTSKIKCMVGKDTIETFDNAYPSFMLKSYLENGGKNIFIPLFAANYNKCMELLYKSKIPVLAENFEHIKKNNTLPLYKNNLKDIFGIPVKTLKRIASKDLTREPDILNRLSEIYNKNQRLLCLESYNMTALHFLKYQNVVHDKPFKSDNYYSVKEIDSWSDEEIFRTLKYLNKLNDTLPTGDYNIKMHTQWDIYRDYINMSLKLGEYIKGKWPKNLKEAHDLASELCFAKEQEIQDREFKEFIHTEFYQKLTTDFGDDAEKFQNERYTIIAPSKAYDLVNESAQMNNCVKNYIRNVCDKKTMIYFLRLKKDINKSVCTIEITPNKCLRQLKAYGNHQANDEIKEFVKLWAKIKEIKLSSYDIS